MAAYVSTDSKPETNFPNRAVFQSYIWTCAKYDFSPYEKRIIYRIIEFAQRWIEGIKMKDNMRKIEPTNCGVNITMPVSDILRDETDNNYSKAKAAFTSLSKKGTGLATFHIYEPVWKAALDFTKGYKRLSQILLQLQG